MLLQSNVILLRGILVDIDHSSNSIRSTEFINKVRSSYSYGTSCVQEPSGTSKVHSVDRLNNLDQKSMEMSIIFHRREGSSSHRTRLRVPGPLKKGMT